MHVKTWYYWLLKLLLLVLVATTTLLILTFCKDDWRDVGIHFSVRFVPELILLSVWILKNSPWLVLGIGVRVCEFSAMKIVKILLV